MVFLDVVLSCKFALIPRKFRPPQLSTKLSQIEHLSWPEKSRESAHCHSDGVLPMTSTFIKGWVSPSNNVIQKPTTTETNITPLAAMMRVGIVIAGLIIASHAPAQAACTPPSNGGVSICSPAN